MGHMGAVVEHPVWLDEAPDGVKVADVAWAPSAFFAQHEFQVPYSVAPAICVEIKSRANARVEPLAKELWLIDAKGSGDISRSSFSVDVPPLT